MEDKIKVLRENHTWDLVDLPTGKQAVGCNWVFTIKMKPDGTLEARLVDKGYS